MWAVGMILVVAIAWYFAKHDQQLRVEVDNERNLDEHAALMIQAVAWTAAWKRRHEHGAAAMVTLMSAQHLGAPVSVQIEKRLLLAKAHIDVRLADLAGRLAGAIATLGGDADTSGIAKVVREAVTRVGGAEEDFGSKIAELGPLADGYRRLRTALG